MYRSSRLQRRRGSTRVIARASAVVAFTLAPAAASACTHSVCPLHAATNSGVLPSYARPGAPAASAAWRLSAANVRDIDGGIKRALTVSLHAPQSALPSPRHPQPALARTPQSRLRRLHTAARCHAALPPQRKARAVSAAQQQLLPCRLEEAHARHIAMAHHARCIHVHAGCQQDADASDVAPGRRSKHRRRAILPRSVAHSSARSAGTAAAAPWHARTSDRASLSAPHSSIARTQSSFP
jgi:hypothetical protein